MGAPKDVVLLAKTRMKALTGILHFQEEDLKNVQERLKQVEEELNASRTEFNTLADWVKSEETQG